MKEDLAKAKPFLKWAGGKKALLPELLKHVPSTYNRYFEPFLGSGTLYFALRPKEAFLSDLNEELINTYKQIEGNAKKVIAILKLMKYGKDYYYKTRSKSSRSGIFRAAKFIYLNRTCWNGLYRVNAKGGFNVPFGSYINPIICDEDNLNLASRALRDSHIFTATFCHAIKTARENDFIYFDPPYTTSHKNNGFIEYNSKIFSLEDQKKLVDIMKRLNEKKCKIVMSNADHPLIRKYYDNFNIHTVKRKSLIAGDKDKRKEITELVITNY